MPVTVVMHRAALEAVGPRLSALGLDLRFGVFDASGRLEIEGRAVAPSETEADYLWLSPHVFREPGADRRAAMRAAFDLALGLRRLDLMQTFNAGLDDPAYAEIARKGVRLCNSSAQGVAIAEYVMAQVFALLHPVERQRAQQREKAWQVTPFREISRTSWLIVGHGPVGEALALRVKAFGAEVAVVRRSPAKPEGADRVGTLADLPRLLPAADVIVLACPLTAETRGMADAAFFAAVKPGAILVNVARGGLVDDAALLAALDAGRPETAVLDVFDAEPLPADSPFWTHPEVRVTPHTSFAGDGTQERWERQFLDTLPRYVRGEPLPREVDPRDLA